MSSTGPLPYPSTRPVRADVGPRHAVPVDAHVRRARWWTVGVLALGTLTLAAYTAMLLLAAWLFASAYAVVSPGSGGVDVLAVVRSVLPALLVGWCLGLAAHAVLARGETLGARTVGVLSGLLGVSAGATVLAASGLL